MSEPSDALRIALTAHGGTLDGAPLTGGPEEAFAAALELVSRQAISLPDGETLTVEVTDARPHGYKPARSRVGAGQSLTPTLFPRRERPKGMAGIPVVSGRHHTAASQGATQATQDIQDAQTVATPQGAPVAGQEAAPAYSWPSPVPLPQPAATTQPEPQPAVQALPESTPQPEQAPVLPETAAAPQVPQEAPERPEPQSAGQEAPEPVVDPQAVLDAGASPQPPSPPLTLSAAALFGSAVPTRHRAPGASRKAPSKRRKAAHRAPNRAALPDLFRPASARSRKRAEVGDFPADLLPRRRRMVGSPRQHLYGTGEPLVADRRTLEVAAHPRSLALAPVEALPVAPLTEAERAKIADAEGFMRYVPRVPVVQADLGRQGDREGRRGRKERESKPWTRRRIAQWAAVGVAVLAVGGVVAKPYVVETPYTAVCVDARTGLRAEQAQCEPGGGSYYVTQYVRTSAKAPLVDVGQAVDGSTSWPRGKVTVTDPSGKAVSKPSATPAPAGEESQEPSQGPSPTSTATATE